LVPKVSVVIPVYCGSEDQEGYLAETLESVAAQSYRDFETVIVDDASPRDITSLLSRFESKLHPVLVRHESNLRQAASRNDGLQAARGELVAFLDHDDVWMPNKLAMIAPVFEEEPGANLVFSAVEIMGYSQEIARIDQSVIPRRPDFDWFFRHGNYVITTSAAVVRREALIQAGGFDSRYTTADDFDAWLKLLMSAPAVCVPERLVRYRLHESNLNYRVVRANDTRLLLRLYLRYWRRAGLRSKLHMLPRLARKSAGVVYHTLRRW
jgi:glycosyltransferase involved in cell wall biosynthesis